MNCVGQLHSGFVCYSLQAFSFKLPQSRVAAHIPTTFFFLELRWNTARAALFKVLE